MTHNPSHGTDTVHDLASLILRFVEEGGPATLHRELLETPEAAFRALPDAAFRQLAEIQDPSEGALSSLYALLYHKAGGDSYDPDLQDETLASENEERQFGEHFAVLASHVPTPTPPIDGLSSHGADLLVDLCRTLPRVSSHRATALRNTESAEGCARENATLAQEIVQAGLLPLTFLDVSRAAVYPVFRARRLGELDGEVILRSDGTLGGSWDGDPNAALHAAIQGTETDAERVRVCLVWLVAAAEIAPFLFPRHRAERTTEGLVLAPLSVRGRATGVDDPLSSWVPAFENVEVTP